MSASPKMTTTATSSTERISGPSIVGWLLFAWGAIGFFALLARALARLAPLAWEAMAKGMTWWQWATLGVWVVAMAYMEGYRGFQKRFSPRFAARAMHLAASPSWGRGLLAPFFCMGLFHATRRVKILSWSVLIGVVVLILLIRELDQPWRGIIDAGVVVGLLWGVLANAGWLIHAARGRPLPSGPEVPR